MTEYKADITEPFKHDIEFYQKWKPKKDDRMSVRLRPKFTKSLIEDIEHINKLKIERLNFGQTQALLMDIGLRLLQTNSHFAPLLEIEQYLLHDTKAGNSSEVIEHYEDANMPFKFANITIADTTYKISIEDDVSSSLGNFAKKIRLQPSTVATLCLLFGAYRYVKETGYAKHCRQRNISSLEGEIENLDRWIKRQIVRLFVEYDDFTFDLNQGIIKFQYAFNPKQNFEFVGEFREFYKEEITFTEEFEKKSNTHKEKRNTVEQKYPNFTKTNNRRVD